MSLGRGDIEKAREWRRRSVEKYQQRAAEKGRKPINPQNKKRRAKEFARAYGSKERVIAMKFRPCDGCGRVPHEDEPNENAHTEGGGAGRKADFATIVTLCKACHRLWHYLGSTEAFDGWKGTDLRATAARLAEEVRP